MTTGAPLPTATFGMLAKGAELEPPPIIPRSQSNVRNPSTAPTITLGLLRSILLSAGGTKEVFRLFRAA